VDHLQQEKIYAEIYKIYVGYNRKVWTIAASDGRSVQNPLTQLYISHDRFMYSFEVKIRANQTVRTD